MDKSKILLMVGGVLIAAAIILRIAGVTGLWPILGFSIGGTLKAVYLTIGVRSGRFKLGSEIVLLPMGVTLVLVGVFFKSTPSLMHYYGYFIVAGVMMKSTFLFLFFRRQRNLSKVNG